MASMIQYQNTYKVEEDEEGWPSGLYALPSPVDPLETKFPIGSELKLPANIMPRVAVLQGSRHFNQKFLEALAAAGIDPKTQDPTDLKRYDQICSDLLYNPETYAGLPNLIPNNEVYRALAHEAVALWAASGYGAKIHPGLYGIPYYHMPDRDSPDCTQLLFREWLYSGANLEMLIAEALFGAALIRDPETSPEEKEGQRTIVIRNIGFLAFLEIEALKKDRILEYAPLNTHVRGQPITPFLYRNLGAATNGPPSYLDDRACTFENLAVRYLGSESEKVAELVIGIFFEGMMVKRSDLDGDCRLDLIRVPSNKEYYAALALPQLLRKRATDALRRAALQEIGSTYTCPSWCNGTPQARRNGSHLSHKSERHKAAYRQAAAYYTKAADLLDADFPVVNDDPAQSEALMTLVYAYFWYAEINDTIGPDCEVDASALEQSLDAIQEAERIYAALRSDAALRA